MPDAADESLDELLARVRELAAEGRDHSWAWGLADLENRIRNWPTGWGEDLQILVYGGFNPPPQPIVSTMLGITIHPEKLEGTIIRNSLTVLKATVQIADKTVPALVDAARRINVFLGSHTLVSWGNAECGWWSYVTHGTFGGVHSDLEGDDIIRAAESICTLPPVVRRKVDAALYWIRVPRHGIFDSYRSDLLAVYAGYWNALECLVDAVCALRPATKATKLEKQAAIDELLRLQNGHITVADVASLYTSVVSPGLVPKAAHAFAICFPEHADQYFH